MSLSPGAKLGLYEIVAPLGAGGMGEVYRAKDTRLERTVAIKLLPAGFSANLDRLQRFEQEARSASALNHPNIVTIYELGQDGSTHYIAMELVEGKTLREMLSAGPLPMRKAIEIAAQIADGLTKAHEAGITHRDLKPENLMVSHDGFIKILDFGLAKHASPSGKHTDLANTSASLTGSGLFWALWAICHPSRRAGRDWISGQISFHSAWCSMKCWPESTPSREAHQRKRWWPLSGNRLYQSEYKTAMRPLPCVGPSRGAWQKNPTSATCLHES